MAFNLRDLAKQAGITTPTLYAYFDSKHAIYDAMFGRSAKEFVDRMNESFDSADPPAMLASYALRFVEFCTSDVVRYHLLFQRTVPDFEPSPESYAPAVQALEGARKILALNGITQRRHLDLFTAMLNGLADQQVANDPGGNRWTRLVPEAVTMFITHCRSTKATRASESKARTKGVQP